MAERMEARRARDVLAEMRAASPRLDEAEREMGSAWMLAKNVLRLRVQRGWTQPELARRAGIAKSRAFAVETGTANATLATVDRLARALQCSPADLLSAVQDQENPVHAQEVPRADR